MTLVASGAADDFSSILVAQNGVLMPGMRAGKTTDRAFKDRTNNKRITNVPPTVDRRQTNNPNRQLRQIQTNHAKYVQLRLMRQTRQALFFSSPPLHYAIITGKREA